MSFGVTPEGYNLKTQAEINDEAETALEQVTDPATYISSNPGDCNRKKIYFDRRIC